MDTPTITLSLLPTSGTVICQFAPLAIDEFFTLNEGSGTSAIEKDTPIVEVRRSGAMEM
jgi:hypothetical protein